MDRQCQYRADTVFTLDGTWRTVEIEGPQGKISRRVAARVAARHDGLIRGVALEEDEGCDNYLAEMAAQLDALADEPAGGRKIIVFDATSPVSARERFERVSARVKAGYYAGTWLEEWGRLINRQEVVVFV